MNIYSYDAESLIYLSISIADQDPLDPTRWLIPAHATTVSIGVNKPFLNQKFDPITQRWVYVINECTRPSDLYDFDDVQEIWVLNQDRQAAQESASEASNKSLFQKQLDSHLVTAISIAQALEYAATRQPLSDANAARLTAYHNYIDALIGLEYTDSPIWPNSPDI